MTTEAQREQAERRRVLANDQRVREQTGTFMSHTHSDAGGRFSAVGAAYVIGSTAVPQYPQASGPFQRDPVPDEPPLGFDNPALEFTAPAVSQGLTGDADVPSLTPLDDVERAASPSSLMAAQRKSQMSSSSLQVGGVRTERPPWRRL
jgi:hypothetical protein